MEQLWKIAFSVAGIGAIGFFVLFSLYRQWLRLEIFARLTSKQTYRLMMTFVILTFLSLIAGLGAYVWVPKPEVDNAIGRPLGSWDVKTGGRYVSEWMDQLEDLNWRMREEAAIQLMQAGPAAAKAVPLLTEIILNDDAVWVRGAAADALGVMGESAKTAIPALEELERWGAERTKGGDEYETCSLAALQAQDRLARF